MLERADPKLVTVLQKYNDALIESRIADAAVRRGDHAPDFTLPDQDGRPVSLSATLARGPVVLAFIRGGWCPYCTLTLRAFAKRYPALRRHGAEVLAISPESPQRCASTADCSWLPFPVLSDHANAVARLYRVVVALPPEMQAVYRRLGHDLPTINGVPGWELSMPATYVIAPDGRIVLDHVDPRAHSRMEPQAALEAVEMLTQPAE
jgi:peroxiredoxin